MAARQGCWKLPCLGPSSHLHTPDPYLLHVQVKLLVEKTGCDAATLTAPFVLHGSEAGLLNDATVQTDPTIHLRFMCEELLVQSPHLMSQMVPQPNMPPRSMCSCWSC